MRNVPPVVLILAGLSFSTRAEPPDNSAYLGPREFLELMEKSPQEYKIESESAPLAQWSHQNAMLIWPAVRQELGAPAVKVERNGQKTVVEWPRDPAAEKLMRPAEDAFEANDFEHATQAYKAVLEKFPNYYPAILGLGDCAANAKDFELAFKFYNRAAPLLPSDHHNWWYRADTELARGNKNEAIKLYIHALALAPRSEGLRAGLEARRGALGLTVKDDNFLPYARVERDGKAIVIKISKGSANQPVSITAWLAWGNCKAAWLGEVEHRKAMTGSSKVAFTSKEELECLVNLVTAYDANEKDKAGGDDVAAFVGQVVKAKMLHEMVVYEIASRIDPHIVLTLPDDEVARLEAYVKKFVFVPVHK